MNIIMDTIARGNNMITKHDCSTNLNGETEGCGHCEQDARIKENMASDLDYALETGDLAMFEDIFEDRDPFEFL